MSLKLSRRNGFWHYGGTIGPPERRARLRGSTGLEATTKNKATAQREIAEIETRYWKGAHDGPAAILTFEVAVRNYLAVGKPTTYIEPILKYLGKTLVKNIKPSTIRQMAIELYPDCSGATRNRAAITPTQAIINLNAKAELCSMIRVEHFDEFNKVKTPVTLEWLMGFQNAAGEILSAFAFFMFLTGCRPSEGLTVDYDRDLDLTDLNNASAIINNGKVGHERKAHLPRMLAVMLVNLPREPGRPLFWYFNLKVVRYPWDQAIKRAGIKRLTPHCCRHGAVTGLLRSGLDVVTVGKLVDMTPQMVLETYGHAIDDVTLTNRLLDTPLPRGAFDNAGNLLKSGTS